MKPSLYIFNPDHDLALANNDPHFNAPLSARRLVADLSALPWWFAGNDAVVWISKSNTAWVTEMKALFSDLKNVEVSVSPDFASVCKVFPWGWNFSLLNLLEQKGVKPECLPDHSMLEKIRQLSHRRMASQALAYLSEDENLKPILPDIPVEIKELETVRQFVSEKGAAVLKAPWSGSGKGLCWIRQQMTASNTGWFKNTVEKQGSVMAEQVYDKVLDFAMEFDCSGEHAVFLGYSLFEAEKGIYRNNILMSQDDIETTICSLGVSLENMKLIKTKLLWYVENELKPYYKGFLGIDMMLFRDGEKIRVHPCVEINLRMTMGAVAALFYERFIEKGMRGRFYIDHETVRGKLWTDHLERKKCFPLKIVDGRIVHGYLSLSDVFPDSVYRARVEISNTDSEK